MDGLSDSDFDFELEGPFETVESDPDNVNTSSNSETPHQTAAIPQPRSVSRPPSSYTAPSSTKQPNDSQNQTELYKAIGENTILRTRLDNVEQEHRNRINELLTAQTRAREEQREQLEDLRKKLQVERYQHDLQLKDMKAQMISMSGPPTESSSNVRKTREEMFGDGFEVKKPKLATANPARDGVAISLTNSGPTALAGASSNAVDSASFRFPPPPVQAANTIAINSTNNEGQHSPNPAEIRKNNEDAQRVAVNQLLVSHYAPGNTDSTLKVLYSQSSSFGFGTFGEQLAGARDCDTLISRILYHDAFHYCEFTSNVPAVLMSLLTSALLLPYKLNEYTRKEVVERVTASALLWFTDLQPLPSLEDVQKHGRLPVEPLRQYNSVLWALDALIAINWPFDLSVELIKCIFSRQNCPPLHTRGYELIAKHPSNELTQILISEVPKHVVVDYRFELVRILPNQEIPGGLAPTTELLFCGLKASDDGKSVLRYTSRLPKGTTYVSLVEQSHEIIPLIALILKRARAYVVQMQCDWLHAAVHCLPTPQPLTNLASSHEQPSTCALTGVHASLDRAVLSLLSCSLQDSAFVTSPVLYRALLYFWSRSTESLRETMSGPDLTELVICLAIIVHNNVDENNIVTQSRTILSELTVDGELDNYFDAFRPRSEWNEADYTVDGSDASVDGMIIKAEQMFL